MGSISIVLLEIIFFVVFMGWVINTCTTNKDKSQEIKKSQKDIFDLIEHVKKKKTNKRS